MSPFLITCTLLATFPVGQEDSAPPVRIERQVGAMGTTLGLVLEAPTRAQALAASEAALTAVEEVEARLSSWRPHSELSRLNRAKVGVPFEASPELVRDLERAFAWRETSTGAFDPAILALIHAWDLRGDGRRPSPSELAAARANSGPLAFELDGDAHVLRLSQGAGLDTGAFGKGAGLDAALESLRAAGIRHARLDFGGQIAVLAEEQPHTLAIAAPDDRARGVLALDLHEGSAATSGNSERHVMVDGERLGHLLDPRSGMPAPDFGSVTVRCPSAFDADCLATSLFVLGPEAALELATRLPEVEIVLLTRRHGSLRARATAGLRGHLHTLDPDLPIEWIGIPSNPAPVTESQL
jgi:thiamine biosynthesis lipoprotein